MPRDTGATRDGSNFKFATFEASVAIDRNGTWVVAGRESVALLEHERRHWMMDILVARELHAALEALRSPTASGLNGLATREFDWHRNTREKALSDLAKKQRAASALLAAEPMPVPQTVEELKTELDEIRSDAL